MRHSGSLRGKRVLVTGAAGFIGSHLRRRLVNEGAKVYGVSRESRRSEDEVNWLEGDLSHPETVDDIFKQSTPDLVFHLAGYVFGAREEKHILPTLYSNAIATLNVLKSASKFGSPRTLLSGSMEEKGVGSEGLPPSSPYAASKCSSTLYARMFYDLYQLPVTTLRIFMTYGPGQCGPHSKKLIPYTILSLLQGNTPRIENGIRDVDWIYVEDVADAFILAAEAESSVGEIVDVGSGELHTIRSVVDRLVDMIDPGITPEFVSPADRAPPPATKADMAKTSALIDWRPTTPLEQGLEMAIAWYAERLGAGYPREKTATPN